jgi:nicotinic acid mononucleotide adenylyltransferase/nicotinamide mononucleotide (NMN) deamidase PncC
MASSLPTSLIELLNLFGAQVVVVVSGGGTQVIPQLLAEGGASNVMLEALVPYAKSAVAEFLGGNPDAYCSDRTTRQLAVAGWQRSVKLSSQGRNNVGIAATASLRSGKPKMGQHRVHVATHRVQETVTATLQLKKNARSRLEEEHVAALLCLDVLVSTVTETTNHPWRKELESLLLPEEEIVRNEYRAPVRWQKLWISEEVEVPIEINSVGQTRQRLGQVNNRLIFSGSFSPLHEGHLAMAHIAEEIAERPVEWELSVTNVDKPMLDYIEVSRRVEQFKGKTLWLSRAATFIEKVHVFPQSTFVMGADTYVRLIDPKYYHGSQKRLNDAMRTICRQSRGLIVFGRMQDQKFQNPTTCDVPPALREITYFVSEREFRMDVSSSGIRANKT